MNRELRNALLAMEVADCDLMDRLAKQGTLRSGYPKQLELLHHEHSDRLEKILRQYGWPGRSLVGDEGAVCACKLLQHSAIVRPALMHEGMRYLQQAVAAGEASRICLAYVQDRICFYERRPQIYGTQFDWDENDEFSPWAIEDEDCVEERRRALGMRALEEVRQRIRDDMRENSLNPPKAYPDRQREIHAFARRTGWIA